MGAQPTGRRRGRFDGSGIGAGLCAVSLVAVLGGCGGATEPECRDGRGRELGSPVTNEDGVTGGRNQIDVDFAQMMLVHHRQAVEIARLAAENTDKPVVQAIAGRVIASHEPEIIELEAMLVSWGDPVPDDIDVSAMDHTTMDHEGIGIGFMAGMADGEKITLLEAAQGDTFDRPFLRLVRLHLGGGVAMAQAEQISGGDKGGRTVARRMELDQAEIMSEIEDALRCG